MRRPTFILILAMMAGLLAAPAFAGGRPDKDWSEWFGHFGIGYNFAQGTFGDIVDDDLHFDGGATYWPDSWNVGINLDVSYDERDISSSAIRAINNLIDIDPTNDGSVSGGDVRTWGFSVDAIWGPDSSGDVGFYLLGGVGFDDIKGKITDNGLVYYPPFCDPWYWWCYPGGVGPGTFVVGSKSTTEFTYNVGIGVTFDLASEAQIYIEARYKTATTDREDTETVPLVVGVRW